LRRVTARFFGATRFLTALFLPRSFINGAVSIIIQKAQTLSRFNIHAQATNDTGTVTYLIVQGDGDVFWSGVGTGAWSVASYTTSTFTGIAGQTMRFTGYDTITMANSKLQVHNESAFSLDNEDQISRSLNGVTTLGVVNINSEQNDNTTSELILTRAVADDTISPTMNFLKAGVSFDSPGAVADGEILGTIAVAGYGGAEYSPSADVIFEVDGTVTSSRIPGKMRVMLRRIAGGANREILAMSFNSGIRFNSELENVDFIVDGQGANLIFADASAGRVGIATAYYTMVQAI